MRGISSMLVEQMGSLPTHICCLCIPFDPQAQGSEFDLIECINTTYVHRGKKWTIFGSRYL